MPRSCARSASRGDAPPLDHADFGEQIGFVDADHAAEVSGSRFAYLTREAVLLELALVQWVMTRLVAEGFTPVVPPVLVRERAMEEAGFFPTDRDQVYEVDGGELFLVGTSEVPLSGLHRGEILDAGALPLRYGGFSTCFRREAGTYGKDTRGIFRVHQFDKVEMFSFAHPDRSWEELDALLAVQESIVAGLGLPYRVVDIAAGDLGRRRRPQKYDIEVWLPSEGPVPRAHLVLQLHRLLRPPPRDPLAGGERHRAGAHAQRHGMRGRAHARVPVRALPASRRLVRGARGADPAVRLRPGRAARVVA